MAVYVDWLMNHGWCLRGRIVESCHMFADTEEELIEFAVRIGLKPNWIQKKSITHFDLTAGKREAAVRAGAIQLTKETWRDVTRRLRKQDEREPVEGLP